ncbi:MAG: PepSY domain-containing protein [Pseudomonadota bacterium]
MKKSTTLAALGGASLAALIAVTSAAQAHTAKYDAVTAVGTDLPAALALARAAVPGTVMGAELERHKGQMVWEIKLLDENQQRTRLILDADTGEVLKQKAKRKPARHTVEAVSIEAALEAADIPADARVIEAELERDDGKVIWEIETIGPDNTRTDIDIDGETGAVL